MTMPKHWLHRYSLGLSMATLVIVLSGLLACGGGGGSSQSNTSPQPTPAPADTVAPEISVSGSLSLDHEQGTAYEDAGATAQDAVDGTLTPIVSGTVDINTVDVYTITYTATDSAGNQAIATRTVTVVAPTPTGPQAIDADKWFHQTRLPDGNAWFNGEVQHYTDRLDNSYVSDGTLKIVAKKETFTDQNRTKQYTSARLNSKYAFTYGRVEVRAKLPEGAGTWPAIWMLGKNINENGGY